MAKKQKEPRRAISLGDGMLGQVDPAQAVQIAQEFELTANGLMVHGQPAIDKWEPVGRYLRVVERGAQLAIGDFANELEARFGEVASQILDADSGWSLRTLANYQWVARSIDLADRRMDRLGIRHHQVVAPLAKSVQRKWLAKAAADDEEKPWTVARLKAAIAAREPLVVTAYWILVKANSEDDQAMLMETLEAQGRSCRAVMRRRRKADAQQAA